MNNKQELDLQVGVKALLENSKGEFLLLRKNGNISGTRNFWDLPGGRINRGESLSENLIREIKEETQINVHEDQQLAHVQDIIKPEKGIHVVRITYHIVLHQDPEKVVLDDEHLEYKWVTLDDMKKESEIDSYILETLDYYYD